MTLDCVQYQYTQHERVFILFVIHEQSYQFESSDSCNSKSTRISSWTCLLIPAWIGLLYSPWKLMSLIARDLLVNRICDCAIINDIKYRINSWRSIASIITADEILYTTLQHLTITPGYSQWTWFVVWMVWHYMFTGGYCGDGIIHVSLM